MSYILMLFLLIGSLSFGLCEVFRQMYDVLTEGGILVTYCSKSMVRRNMKEAGFDVGKLPGPPGKREMVRAIKK
jgi:tRNA U34 5-methylaminomethyl-2-thiouridine-forming methyltransferase MnmC